MNRDLIIIVQWLPIHLRRALLWLCLLALLSITIFPQGTALGRYEQRHTYQVSPLSPLATPLTATVTTTLSASQSLSVTAALTTALTTTASVAVTVPLTVPESVSETVQVTSPLTVPVTEVAATPVTPTATVMVAIPITNATVVNDGQVSLLLIGAVLASILVVIAVIIGRRR